MQSTNDDMPGISSPKNVVDGTMGYPRGPCGPLLWGQGVDIGNTRRIPCLLCSKRPVVTELKIHARSERFPWDARKNARRKI